MKLLPKKEIARLEIKGGLGWVIHPISGETVQACAADYVREIERLKAKTKIERSADAWTGSFTDNNWSWRWKIRK